MLFNMPIRKLKIGLLVLIGLLVAALVPASVIGRNRLVPATDLDTAGTLGVGMVCEQDDPTSDPTPGSFTRDLETTTGYFSSPDGNQIFMWGYSLQGHDFQMPGPVLCVNEGDVVTINLTNTPGNLDEPVSIVFPGQIGVSASMISGTGNVGLFTLEANPGETVAYTFTASNPGTYLYESGTAQHRQIEMGLYGALIVRPTMGDHFTYNDPDTEFKEEYLLLMHEIDPDLHAKVELGETDYDITTRHDRYWTLNGRSFPDIVAPNNAAWLPGQPYSGLVLVEAYVSAHTDPGDLYYDPDFKPALIRYANAGLENHPFHPHGNTMHVIGRDGRQLTNPLENFTTTVGSGQTYDLLFQWEDKDGWDPVTNPLPLVEPVPDYLNRVYKDGYTFFSGDPYLGDPGPNDYFPVGTTQYNVCGEFYFPWHSHALNEIQNFDEGFGGMLTLVGVFPPVPTSGPDPCAAVRD